MVEVSRVCDAPARRVVVAILLAVLAAGCADRAGPSVEGPETPPSSDGADRDVQEAVGVPWFDVAFGTPFVQSAVDGGCDIWSFRIGARATSMDIRLVSRHTGVGYATLMVDAPDRTYEGPREPADDVAMAFDDPDTGRWTITVFPNGPVRDQEFDLHVVVSFLGSDAPELGLSGTQPGGFSCPERGP